MTATTTLTPTKRSERALATFLRDRRSKLDPEALGFVASRRRTPGLRREEVAQRANISTAWYINLEQGRGGAPSAEVLDGLSKALVLTDSERDHLYHLGLGRTPSIPFERTDHIEPRLQSILDALSPSPALIKNALWDVVAWNQAAAVLWPSFERLQLPDRNTLKLFFLDPYSRQLYCDWEGAARTVVAGFRSEVARVGAIADVAQLIRELSAASPEFAALWKEKPVEDMSHAVKQLQHPALGQFTVEASILGVDKAQSLSMLVLKLEQQRVSARLQSLLRKPGDL